MILVSKECTPRSVRDTYFSFNTFCDYRAGLLFWVRREYEERTKINMGRLYNKLTEVMQYSANEYGMISKRADASKTHLGLIELSILMDYDLRTCPFVEVCEAHHLAWAMMRICALRPSSIGPPNKVRSDQVEPHLKTIFFGDATITRGR